MPERVFDADRFLADVEAAQREYGFVSIVCGEGLKYADGTPVSAARTQDKFGNTEFGAAGGSSAALNMHGMITAKLGWRGEFQITESLCMSAIDRAVRHDLAEAYECGRAAIRLADQGKSGRMVTLVREPGRPYRVATGEIPLHDVAIRARPLPPEFINAAGNFPTDAFLAYARPLVGRLPAMAKLKYKGA
jgi:6-phosphofructokinase 1